MSRSSLARPAPSVEPAGDGLPAGTEAGSTETGTDSRAAAIANKFSGTTAWARNLEAPLRDFLRTETGSAAFLLAGAVCALIWANIGTSYERVWTTSLSVLVGGSGVEMDLRHWVNSGLMTLFFFVVGLEARREFDLGDLRDRRRLLLPVVAGIGGMVVPVAIFLAIAGAHAPPAPGARRCRPTPRSRSECWRSSVVASRTRCGRSC